MARPVLRSRQRPGAGEGQGDGRERRDGQAPGEAPEPQGGGPRGGDQGLARRASPSPARSPRTAAHPDVHAAGGWLEVPSFKRPHLVSRSGASHPECSKSMKLSLYFAVCLAFQSLVVMGQGMRRTSSARNTDT